jgi:hypothetical protein
VEKIIDFVMDSGYNFQQVLISNIAPEWSAKHNYENLTFDLYDFKKFIPWIVNKCTSNGKILRFFWMPLCILWDEYANYSNDEHWEERHTIERVFDKDWNAVLVDIYSPDNSRERAFVEKCKKCKWKEKPCTWIFQKYLDIYHF